MSYKPTNPNGQKTSANSEPIVIASDQSPVPITVSSLPIPSGASTEATLALIKAKTDNIDVALSTRAVTGLTDSQLRASAVPVSIASMPTTAVTGTFYQGTQPVSNSDITALNTKMPSGLTVTANRLQVELPPGGTGLSDLELRATAVPVSISSIPVGLTVIANRLQVELPSGGSGLSNSELRAAAVPVSIASMPTTAVTGTFFQGTQPVSIATAPVLITGSAIIGRVGIDQTTDGTTNKVHIGTTGTVAIGTALPAGSATIGAVNIAASQTLATVTTVSAVTAITNALPTGSNIIGKVSIDQATPGTTNLVALTAETTKVIGTVNVAASQTIAATQSGVFTVQPGNTANTTAWKVDGSAVTQPVSGTVSVNALPTGSNTIGAVNIAASQTLATVTTVSTVTNVSQQGGVAISLNTGVRDTGTQRVTIATNDVVPITDNAGSLTVDAPVGTPVFVRLSDGTTNISTLPVSIASMPTTAVTGTFWQGTQPVSIATAPVLVAGTAIIGALVANQTVNTAQVNAVTVNIGVGAASTGTQRVAVASDSSIILAAGTAAVGTVTLAAATTNVIGTVRVVGNIGAVFDGATAAAVPANALFAGARAATANPTNATGGNMVGIMADKAGRLVVVNGQIREQIGIQQTNVATTTVDQAIVAAGGAGIFRDLSQLIITTAGAAAQTITIKDASTTRMIINYPNAAIAPGAPFIINFNPPIPQAVAANTWNVSQSAATACNYTAVYINNL